MGDMLCCNSYLYRDTKLSMLFAVLYSSLFAILFFIFFAILFSFLLPNMFSILHFNLLSNLFASLFAVLFTITIRMLFPNTDLVCRKRVTDSVTRFFSSHSHFSEWFRKKSRPLSGIGSEALSDVDQLLTSLRASIPNVAKDLATSFIEHY